MLAHHRLQLRQLFGLILFLFPFCAGMVPAAAGASTLTTLVNLPAPNGSNPLCRLIQGSDGNFYATTIHGGAHGYGAVVRVSSAGAATLLYSFTGGNDGSYPQAGVIQGSDGNFYGTAAYSGAHGGGTVYKLTPSGTFSLLYTFTGGADGAYPLGALIQGTDGNLYGTANGGGNGYGTIFKLTLSGSLTTLYDFTNGADGDGPWAGLIQGSDGNFYGTSNFGSPNGAGAIVKMTSGGSVTVLHTFTLATDGGYVVAQLVQGSDGAFYGTAQNGGASGAGTLFKVTSTGTFTKLYDFSGGSDGYGPAAPLVPSGASFYGSTQGGGYGAGTLFQFTPGSGLTTLVKLGQPNGSEPRGGMALGADGNLYGTTEFGGGTGNLFKLTTGGSYSVVYTFPLPLGGIPLAPLMQASDGNLYGTCNQGGAFGQGTVFKLTTTGTLTTLHSFDLFNVKDGAYPHTGALAQALDGNFYDAAHRGGAHGSGIAYRVTTSKKFTDLYDFTSGADGGDPLGGLVQGLDGNLYGTTNSGGANGAGTVYKITPSGSQSVLYSFTGGADGGSPYESTLVLGSDGNFYGATTSGGANGHGTVYKITPSGTLTTLHSFNNADGSLPVGQLCQGTDGAFYGVTDFGGANGNGAIYKVTSSGVFTLLYSFTGGADGGFPTSGLIQASDGNFYGTAQFGGANYNGNVYQFTPTGTLTPVYAFSGSDGANPWGALLQAKDGALYGNTQAGGLGNVGTLFKLDAGLPVLAISALSPTSVLAGGPSVTLIVKGTGFASGAVARWNGNPLATTFVSSAELKATVPAGIAPSELLAYISVANPNGGISNVKTLPVALTAIQVKSVTLTRNSSTQAVTAVVTLKNAGYETAPSVAVTAATLGTTKASNLPVTVGAMAAGATATATLTFPNPGTAGTKTHLAVSGTFTGGTFKGTLTVTLP